MTAPDLDVLVETSDLRAALSSVVVHADINPEYLARHQVYIEVDTENVTITATDGMSSALAIVSVFSNNSGVLGTVGLVPADVKKILQIHQGGKKPAEDEPQHMLQLQVDGKDSMGKDADSDGQAHIVITDQSGMFPGRALRVPLVPQDGKPMDITGLIARLHHGDSAWTEGSAFPGATVARFAVAAKAYKAPIQISSVEGARALLIRVGESFLGALMPVSVHESESSQQLHYNRAWSERLPRPTVAAFTIVSGGETP